MKDSLRVAVVICAFSLAACGKSSPAPSAPSPTPTTGAGGSTLKTSTPVPQSPINNEQPSTAPLVLVASNASPSYAGSVPLQYRFEIYNAAGAVVHSGLVGAGSGTTSYTVPIDLEGETPHTWSVRTEYQGAVGAWSPRAAFVAPTTNGYIRGTELYDPLLNGKSIGNVVGPVTFIPGVGARLETFHSRIVYELQQPLEDGELSALVTGVATNTEGGKTKIFSMAAGYGDLTTNPRRMTVEKRGDGPTGGIAWRFLTSSGDGVDTIGEERVAREFNPSLTYFWEADWRNGFFRVRINEGGVSGRNIYNFGKPYEGFYRPEPHVVYLGGGPARGGPESQTVPGMIIRQVWVSERPRPAFASK